MKLIKGDALEVLRNIKTKSIDLIVTDPPYLIENTKAGGNSKLAKSIQGMNTEIKEKGLTGGFNENIIAEMYRVMKKPNIYIWCNAKQIPMYIDFFVTKNKCKFDILVWQKTNAMPTFNNKYLTDKEYCLYFRKGGYCNPKTYNEAKTVFTQPINIKDKKEFGHPTIKPINIIKTIIENSSKKGELILDPFMGSGTTGAACKLLEREFIGVEIDEEYYNVANQRINGGQIKLEL